jgi:hypothetical protein
MLRGAEIEQTNLCPLQRGLLAFVIVDVVALRRMSGTACCCCDANNWPQMRLFDRVPMVVCSLA